MWSQVLHHVPVLPLSLLSAKSSLTCMPRIIAHVQPHGRPFACKNTRQGRTVRRMFALKREAAAQWHGISSTCHHIIAHSQHQ